jgi:hypothetical protein
MVEQPATAAHDPYAIVRKQALSNRERGKLIRESTKMMESANGIEKSLAGFRQHLIDLHATATRIRIGFPEIDIAELTQHDITDAVAQEVVNTVIADPNLLQMAEGLFAMRPNAKRLGHFIHEMVVGMQWEITEREKAEAAEALQRKIVSSLKKSKPRTKAGATP